MAYGHRTSSQRNGNLCRHGHGNGNAVYGNLSRHKRKLWMDAEPGTRTDTDSETEMEMEINLEIEYLWQTTTIPSGGLRDVILQYTHLDFLPRFLMEEFHPRRKMANAYFLVLASLQTIPEISNTYNVPTILLPLSVVVIVDAVFAILEVCRCSHVCAVLFSAGVPGGRGDSLCRCRSEGVSRRRCRDALVNIGREEGRDTIEATKSSETLSSRRFLARGLRKGVRSGGPQRFTVGSLWLCTFASYGLCAGNCILHFRMRRPKFRGATEARCVGTLFVFYLPVPILPLHPIPAIQTTLK